MKTKVRIVIMSHLSDIQATGKAETGIVNFIKFLLMKFPDTNTEVDPDEEYKDFQVKTKNNYSDHIQLSSTPRCSL